MAIEQDPDRPQIEKNHQRGMNQRIVREVIQKLEKGDVFDPKELRTFKQKQKDIYFCDEREHSFGISNFGIRYALTQLALERIPWGLANEIQSHHCGHSQVFQP